MWIFVESLGSVDRESQARGTAYEHIQIAFSERQSFTECFGIKV